MTEKLDLVLYMMTGGFTVMLTLMLTMWHSLNSRMDALERRMDKFDEKLTDIDRRLCRLEGAFSSKDCCMIKDSSQIRKAE